MPRCAPRRPQGRRRRRFRRPSVRLLSGGRTDRGGGGRRLPHRRARPLGDRTRAAIARAFRSPPPFPLRRDGEPALEDEETLLRELLASHRARDYEAAGWLVAYLARRSMATTISGGPRPVQPRRTQPPHRTSLPGAARRQRQQHALEAILLPPHLRSRRLQPVRCSALLGLKDFSSCFRRGRPEPPRPESRELPPREVPHAAACRRPRPTGSRRAVSQTAFRQNVRQARVVAFATARPARTIPTKTVL